MRIALVSPSWSADDGSLAQLLGAIPFITLDRVQGITQLPCIAAIYDDGSLAREWNAAVGLPDTDALTTYRDISGAPPAPAPLLQITPLQFKQLWTAAEFAAIKDSADPVIQQFFDMANTPGLTVIDLTDALVTGGIGYVSANLHLASGRAAQILSNTPHA